MQCWGMWSVEGLVQAVGVAVRGLWIWDGRSVDGRDGDEKSMIWRECEDGIGMDSFRREW